MGHELVTLRNAYLSRDEDHLVLLSRTDFPALKELVGAPIDSPEGWRVRSVARESLGSDLSSLPLWLVAGDRMRPKAMERPYIRTLQGWWDECEQSDTARNWLKPAEDNPIRQLVWHLCQPVFRAALTQLNNNARRLDGIDAERVTTSFGQYLFNAVCPLFFQCLAMETQLAHHFFVAKACAADSLSHLDTPVYRRSFLSKYPVLWRLASARIKNATASAIEMIERVSADRIELTQAFGIPADSIVEEISWGAGDPHHGGKTVCMIHFSNTYTVVYKPRNLGPEHLLGSLAELLTTSNDVFLYSPKMLERADYGYVGCLSWHSRGSSAHSKRFYFQIGRLLGLAWLIGMTDLHFENIFASAYGPVAVDCETIFDPLPAHSVLGTEFRCLEARALSASPLKTGLLPARLRSSQGAVFDVSGIGAIGSQPSPLGRMAITVSAEGFTQAKRLPVHFQAIQNNLDHNDRLAPAVFINEIIDGWADSLTRISQVRSEVGAMLERVAGTEGIIGRWVFRPTVEYACVLQGITHPSLASDVKAADLFVLAALGRSRASELSDLFAYERAAIWEAEIPAFRYHPSRFAPDVSGSSEIFVCSGIRASIDRLRAVDSARKFGVAAIRASVASLGSTPETVFDRVTANASVPSRREILAEAMALAEIVEAHAVTVTNAPFWVGLSPIDEFNFSAGISRPTLYEGAAGIGVFLSFAEKIFGGGKFTSTLVQIKSVLKAAMEDSVSWSCGGFDGYAGFLYATVFLDGIEDYKAEGNGERYIVQLSDLIAKDENFDLVSGSAGSLLVLSRIIALKGTSSQQSTLWMAAQAARDKLAANAIKDERGVFWHTLKTHAAGLGGFAHGVSGIAYALAEWARLSKDPLSAHLAREAFRYEMTLLDEPHGGWIDGRREGVTTFWCYGAPGICLTARKLFETFGDVLYKEIAMKAMAFTVDAGLANNDCLCHGNFGNTQALGTEDGSTEFFNKVVAHVLARRRDSGRYLLGLPLDAENFGLMTGLAGIGYSLLRYAAPRALPNVLALEIPSGRWQNPASLSI